MAAPNIVNVSSITGKTAVQVVSNSATAIVSNAGGSNTVLKIDSLYVSNTNASTNYTITVDVFRSSTAYRVATAVVVPVAATLSVLTNYIYLEEGDSLRLTASAASQLEAVCSYEIIA